MPFLIDGHNVIAALPDVALEDPHDEAKLVLKLRAWSGRERHGSGNRKVIVVFDGGVPGGYARALSSHYVRVVFAARRHTNADRIIKARLKRLPDPGNWTVVSSDHEVLERARRVGARTMRAQDFAGALNARPVIAKEKPDTVSPTDVAYWLEIFGEAEAQPPPPGAVRARRGPRRRGASPDDAGAGTGDEADRSPAGEASIPSPTPFGEKPGEISEAEVAAWLEVFQDGAERAAPSGRRPPRRRRRSGASTPPKPERSKTLRKHRQRYAPAEGEGTADLSDEEQALWYRLFGKDE
jgi:predicted RNA-binding protein with PIN domain